MSASAGRSRAWAKACLTWSAYIWGHYHKRVNRQKPFAPSPTPEQPRLLAVLAELVRASRARQGRDVARSPVGQRFPLLALALFGYAGGDRPSLARPARGARSACPVPSGYRLDGGY